MSRDFNSAWLANREAKEKIKTSPENHSADPGPESELHNKIIKHCRDNGWIYFHGSMATRTHRTVGEADFCCLLPNGVVLFIECKSATGKLTPQQLALKVWMEKLGHTLHVIRSYSGFIELCGKYTNTRG